MLPARIFSLALSFALPAILSLLTAATAWCDVYKWTDAQGKTVISNIRPADPEKLRNFEVVLKERGGQTPQPPSQNSATPAEQVLLERVETLERQLRTRPHPAQVPPAADYGNYYPAQPPPPPPPGYYSSYDPGYYYAPAPVYTYGTYPVRTVVSRPRVVQSYRSSMRGGSMHRARR